jgi:beta-phosphoglucomutase-like phosphatase (HAD superfamily)
VSAAEAVALEDSPIGVASAAAAGMFVIAVPYFAGTEVAGASMQADSLGDVAVAQALGLDA